MQKTMSEHEHFEELCAAVVSGLASAEELRELENHLRNCEECRDRMHDYIQIGAGILAARTGDGGARRPPAGMTDRFVTRAIAEGVPLRQPTRLLPTWASRHPLAWTGTIAAGVLLAFVAIGNLQRIANLIRPQESATVQALPTVPAGGAATIASQVQTADAAKQLQGELNAALADKERLTEAMAKLNDEVGARTTHESSLAAQIAALQNQLDRARQQSAAKDAQIADLGSQLQRREFASSNQMASLAEGQIQIRNLHEQLDERNATIEQQKQLLAATNQARDLIIARKLHIVDVHDNNGEGERQRAFGRVFYTEGKQIVFYAYDLDSADRLKKQVAFYVWGGRLGDQRVVKNLGVFHCEDVAAGRWVLTFDDPHVLAQINTVFVTAESKKKVDRPDGRQILFAYLGDKANHP